MDQEFEIQALRNEVQILTAKIGRLESEQRRLIELIFKLRNNAVDNVQ